jgi:hypothetical protein
MLRLESARKLAFHRAPMRQDHPRALRHGGASMTLAHQKAENKRNET